MTTTISGDLNAFDLTDLLNADLTVPVNGDPVDATVVQATLQKVVDYVASSANEINSRTVPAALRGYSTVASLKAYSAMSDGDVMMLKDSGYTGGASGVISGVGLFIYDAASTAPESQVTGITGVFQAYLVVAPNSGVGRWINVVAGLGYQLGSAPQFMPRPLPRTIPLVANGVSGTATTTAGAAGYVPPIIGPSLSATLSNTDAISLDFDFSIAAATMSSQILCALEVSVGGGAWTTLPGSVRALGGAGAANNVFVTGHVSAVYTAGATNTHVFRLAVLIGSVANFDVLDSWTARGIQHVLAY